MTSQLISHVADGELKARRQALGLSREALGAIAGGVSSATVRRAERGEVRPHPRTLRALLAALDAAEETRSSDGTGHD